VATLGLGVLTILPLSLMSLIIAYMVTVRQNYGFRLHLMVTTQGTIAHFVLVPGSHHDVTVAPELRETYGPDIVIGADKGYVGLAKRLIHPFDYQFIIRNGSNQLPNTSFEKKFLARFCKLIETTNSQLSEQFNMQYTRAKSAWGLMSHVVYELTAHTLAVYLNALADWPLLAIKSITS
jgi:hypothetical protein